MLRKYDFNKIEKKWQKIWLRDGIYEPSLARATLRSTQGRGHPFYNLMMFPYPSAEGLHVGNMYAFTGADIYGRLKRMQGHEVFEPIGLDGFGIHSENYALKTGKHPSEHAKVSEKRFYKQLEAAGNGFAWKERLETYDPEYYRWTQWIFAQMFKHGLAYRKKQAVNWCPSCKTVLSDEQAEGGKCERCGTRVVKKDLEQWFFRITKYADKLLRNLDKLDWSEKVKIAQRNWIGKSEGAELEFQLTPKTYNLKPVRVFTTRPDTLFGATYMVLSPEHTLIENLKLKIKNWREAGNYIKKSKAKSEEERIENKTKTGVELKGIKAINPATKKEIPIWVADYVLSSYGTGAIMAVPAHDERDFEFAKKYKLPIQQVIARHFIDEANPVDPKKPMVKRQTVECIVKHWREDKYLVLVDKLTGRRGFVVGGIEPGEGFAAAGAREILEETGYKNARFVRVLSDTVNFSYFARQKNENRYAVAVSLLFKLKDREQLPVSKEELTKHDISWVDRRRVLEIIKEPPGGLVFRGGFLGDGEEIFTGDGHLINSGRFDDMPSEKAKREITKAVGGKKHIQFRLRDWLLSRQRYWGPPIPMVHCSACEAKGRGERKDMPGWYAVPEEELPVKLPLVKDFRPRGKGESPLASVKSFYETKCPSCGGKARRETDVSDTFLDSAWYYIGYLMASENWKLEIGNSAFSNLVRKWLPVNMYIGGAEHSVLHLLYVRFLALAMHDMKLLDFGDSPAPKGEPFPKFRAHGLLIKEGAKMSKSKGNVVNPDEYIKKFGADTLRMYLMFLAPFEQGGDFRDAGVLGISRFLERVWKFGQSFAAVRPPRESNPEVFRLLNQTVKKVGEDIENLRYNTAISALMIMLNKMEKSGPVGVSRPAWEDFLKLLAPFAPHIAEELWAEAGGGDSIHVSAWPKYNPNLLKDDTFTLVVQINGKLRDSAEVPSGISEKEAKDTALGLEKIKAALGGREPKRVIYVPGRLINLVL